MKNERLNNAINTIDYYSWLFFDLKDKRMTHDQRTQVQEATEICKTHDSDDWYNEGISLLNTY